MNGDETVRQVRQVGADCWRYGDASLRVRRPSPGVVVYMFSGKMPAELIPQIRAIAEEALRAEQQISLFFDSEEMSGYHPEFRSQMTAWHEELKDVTRYAGVLVRSRIIKMAIAIASLVTGGKLVSYADRRSFETAIQKAVQQSNLSRTRVS